MLNAIMTSQVLVGIRRAVRRPTPTLEDRSSSVELGRDDVETKSMTLAQLEKRVEKLEKLISDASLLTPERNAKWRLNHAGAFANDPGYEQIVRLGRKYRQSLKPKLRKTPR